MSVTDRVTQIVTPLLDALELSLYDVDLNGSTLRVTIDGPDGVDMQHLAQVTKALSRELDEADPMPGKYTLEVSSPGLERRLRTVGHFSNAIDEQIMVKLGPHVETARRLSGLLVRVDESSITISDENGADHEILLADITKAVTVFEWGPGPKPGQPRAKKQPKEVVPSIPDAPQSDRRASVR